MTEGLRFCRAVSLKEPTAAEAEWAQPTRRQMRIGSAGAARVGIMFTNKNNGSKSRSSRPQARILSGTFISGKTAPPKAHGV